MTRHAVFYTAWRVITFISSSLFIVAAFKELIHTYTVYACLLVVLKDSWKSVYNSASSFKHLIHYNHTIHSTAFVFHVGTSLFDHKSYDHFPTSVEEVARKQEI